MAYRLGVDVGGTFTDLLLIDDETGETFRAKTPSTPADPSQGVLVGIEKLIEDLDFAGPGPANHAAEPRQSLDPPNVGLGDIRHLMHGTTVATNAVLEGKGATVGLLVTTGYRQVLQIARSYVPGGLAGWIIWPSPSRSPRWSTPSRCPAASVPAGTRSHRSTRRRSEGRWPSSTAVASRR
jgi:N-methylhydantoinase A